MSFVDFIVSVGAKLPLPLGLVGVAIAYQGLHTWRKQLSGHTNHDLARRLLISIFRRRNAVDMVRRPYLPVEEMRTDDQTEGFEQMDFAQRTESWIRAYQRRWQKVLDLDAEVKALLVEAEALWGSDLTMLLEEVETLERELFVSLRLYLQLQNPHVDEEFKQIDRKRYNERRHIISEQDESDEYRNDYSTALEPVKKYLREKLGDSSL